MSSMMSSPTPSVTSPPAQPVAQARHPLPPDGRTPGTATQAHDRDTCLRAILTRPRVLRCRVLAARVCEQFRSQRPGRRPDSVPARCDIQTSLLQAGASASSLTARFCLCHRIEGIPRDNPALNCECLVHVAFVKGGVAHSRDHRLGSSSMAMRLCSSAFSRVRRLYRLSVKLRQDARGHLHYPDRVRRPLRAASPWSRCSSLSTSTPSQARKRYAPARAAHALA